MFEQTFRQIDACGNAQVSRATRHSAEPKGGAKYFAINRWCLRTGKEYMRSHRQVAFSGNLPKGRTLFLSLLHINKMAARGMRIVTILAIFQVSSRRLKSKIERQQWQSRSKPITLIKLH